MNTQHQYNIPQAFKTILCAILLFFASAHTMKATESNSIKNTEDIFQGGILDFIGGHDCAKIESKNNASEYIRFFNELNPASSKPENNEEQEDAADYESDSVSSEIQDQEEIIIAPVDNQSRQDDSLKSKVAVLASYVSNANLNNNDSNDGILPAGTEQNDQDALSKVQIEDKDVIDNIANNDNGDNNKNKSNLQQQSQIKEMTQEEACDNDKDKNPESADDILKQHNVDLVNPAESKIGQPRLNKKDEVIDRMLDEVNLQEMEVDEEVKVEKNRVVKLKKTIEVRGENNKKKEELERLRQESRNLEDILLLGKDKDKQPLATSAKLWTILCSTIISLILGYIVHKLALKVIKRV